MILSTYYGIQRLTRPTMLLSAFTLRNQQTMALAIRCGEMFLWQLKVLSMPSRRLRQARVVVMFVLHGWICVQASGISSIAQAAMVGQHGAARQRYLAMLQVILI